MGLGDHHSDARNGCERSGVWAYAKARGGRDRSGSSYLWLGRGKKGEGCGTGSRIPAEVCYCFRLDDIGVSIGENHDKPLKMTRLLQQQLRAASKIPSSLRFEKEHGLGRSPDSRKLKTAEASIHGIVAPLVQICQQAFESSIRDLNFDESITPSGGGREPVLVLSGIMVDPNRERLHVSQANDGGGSVLCACHYCRAHGENADHRKQEEDHGHDYAGEAQTLALQATTAFVDFA
jgi:hypothetical protein